MRIRRVVFTGDVLRPGGDRAGHWLRRILGGTVATASGLPVEQVGPDEGFDTGRAYAMWGAERSPSGWAAIADTGIAPRGVLDLFDAAQGEAIVIGFGMAETSKRILTRLGIPFFDLAIHPIRFLDDLFFAVRTNDADVFAAMLPYHAAGARFEAAAGLIAAARDDAPVELPSPTLVVGQRADDPALLREGGFADFSDFPQAMRAATGAGGLVAFRPHPAEPGDLGLFAAGVPFTSLRLARGDLYGLLATGSVKRVLGLSSPILTEARCFGCDTEALLGDPLDLADGAADAEPGQSLSIVDGAFETDFWRDVLAPLIPVTARDGATWRRPPDSLRAAFGRLRPDEDGHAPASHAMRENPLEAEAQMPPVLPARVAVDGAG